MVGVTRPSGTNGSKYTVKIVQWPPISLWLKSLDLDIYKTSPPSARAVVQKL